MRISERVPAIFPTAKQSPLGQGLLIIEALHSHTTLGRTPLDE